MVKALDIRFLKKKNASSNNLINIASHWNIHSVGSCIELPLEDYLVWGVGIHLARYLEKQNGDTFIYLSNAKHFIIISLYSIFSNKIIYFLQFGASYNIRNFVAFAMHLLIPKIVNGVLTVG